MSSLPFPRERRALALACAVALAFADSSIVVLGLPDVLGEFQGTVESVSWVVTGYNLVVAIAAAALVPLAKRIGATRLTAVGTVVFLVSSLACAVAGGLGEL